MNKQQLQKILNKIKPINKCNELHMYTTQQNIENKINNNKQ